jgi:phosphoglycerate kinase
VSNTLPTIERWGDLTGKRVLVRVDFNAPVAEIDGVTTLTDDFRLRSSLPTIDALIERGATVVLCTHFGRPDGRVDERYSVAPLRRALDALRPGIELLENLRFHPGEEANDHDFGASLTEGFDYYVNEAFGASHRAHASITVPPTLLPSAGGANLQREVATLLALLDEPARPFIAVIGGAKVKDKLGIMKVLAAKADAVIVGGGMRYTFAASEGHRIGDSLFDARYVDECAELLAGGNILIPVDSRGLPAGAPFGPEGGPDDVADFGEEIPDGFEGLDIGPLSIEIFTAALQGARTIMWNGPMGVFEDPRFGAGTEAVARAIAASPAVSVVGGGDSVAALASYQLESDVSFVSTGGGASLELVELGDLPGLRALRESPWT